MSNRIRQLRESHNLTLLNLSKKLQTEADLKLSPDAIAKYERGDREPKLETWKELASFFGVSVPYLQGISMNTGITISTIDDVLNVLTRIAKREISASDVSERDLLNLTTIIISARNTFKKDEFQSLLPAVKEVLATETGNETFWDDLNSYVSDAETATFAIDSIIESDKTGILAKQTLKFITEANRIGIKETNRILLDMQNKLDNLNPYPSPDNQINKG